MAGRGRARRAGVDALAEEIRQAGAHVRRVRLTIGASVLLFPATVILLLAADTLIRDPSLWLAIVYYGLPCLAASFLFSALVALPIAAGRRAYRRRQIRRAVADLRPAAREELLAELTSERLGDTRKIVGPLLREFRPTAEVSPAAAREGRGDEPARAAGER